MMHTGLTAFVEGTAGFRREGGVRMVGRSEGGCPEKHVISTRGAAAGVCPGRQGARGAAVGRDRAGGAGRARGGGDRAGIEETHLWIP